MIGRAMASCSAPFDVASRLAAHLFETWAILEWVTCLCPPQDIEVLVKPERLAQLVACCRGGRKVHVGSERLELFHLGRQRWLER